MGTQAQGRAVAKRHAARRGDLDDDTADRASPTDPRRRGLGVLLCPLGPPPAPDDSPDITPDMISNLAQRYWELHGGNAVLNWLEAERALQDLLRETPIHTAHQIRCVNNKGSKAPSVASTDP